MLLSIIIPVYNLEKYISECLDSIVNQVDKNIQNKMEIIIIDDGSKDKSEEICNEYMKKYNFIRYYYQDNSGVSVARNKGLELSSGKYIYFVDGDDILLNNSLYNIFSIINNKDVDMICSDFIKFNDVKELKKIYINKKNIDIYKEKSFYLEKNIINPSLCCNVIKKELFVNNNMFLDENMKYTEDMLLFYKLYFLVEKLEFVFQPIYGYRKSRENSATHAINKKKVNDMLKFIKYWDEQYDYINLDYRIQNYMRGFTSYQYSILVAIIFSDMKQFKNKEYFDIKIYKDKLLNIPGKKGSIIKIFYKIFGFNITGRILSLYLKFKR